ncbi:MAG: hypothetical protein GY895_03340 [Phycisphaera sp.]|nr:hypothetical protein [Phycisphaera sp.]
MPTGFNAWSDAILAAPWSVVAAFASVSLYFIGRHRIRRRSVRFGAHLTSLRATCFVVGWMLMLVAVASPLDAAAERLLSRHMVQHMLLAMVVPPLIWLGAPAMPVLRGLPRSIRVGILGPLLAARPVQGLLLLIGHPVTGWVAMAVVTVAWHVPAAYELAISDPIWHRIEHGSMFFAGILFWRPVVAARPYRDRWPRIAMVPYLVTADLVNTVVAGTLAFGPAPLYRWYGPLSEALGIDPVLDQHLAAGIMWIPGNLGYLIPAMVIAARRFGIGSSLGIPVSAPARTVSLPVLQERPTSPEGGDLLRIPLVGGILRSRRARVGIRLASLAVLLLVVIDGLFGPQDAPMNLAGTIPWTHWRGVVIVGALVLGNVACFGCPLIAPRSVLRRWIRPRMTWPAMWRSKWIAVILVVAWLVVYEAFDPWDAPALTAWILVGFVVVATTVDLLFEGATFCRHVCPLGQFQMAASTMSTRTIAARDPRTCASCTTRDCLEGGDRGPGCGLDLLVPAKRGNLDCTFCLDCVTACPNDNVGILPATPGLDLADPRPRSGLRSLFDRPDLATLLLAITIGGLVNAVGMTAPIVSLLDRIEDSAGLGRRWLEGGGTLLAILAGMALVVLVATVPSGGSWRSRFGRIAVSTLPIGIAIWLVHLGFHLVTGWSTAEASVLRVVHDLGAASTPPDVVLSCCAPPPPWLLPIELLVLSIGMAGSLGVAWWSIRNESVRRSEPLGHASVTWRWSIDGLVPLAIWLVGAWMVFQPMDMRGTAGFAS